MWRIVSGLLLAWLMARSAVAGEVCRTMVRHRALVGSTLPFAVTPFAVPVAVPVATVTVPGVLYRYTAVEPRVPRVGNLQKTQGEQLEAATPEGIITQRCAACHRDSHPSGGLSLSGVSLGGLSRDVRVEIVRRITTRDEHLRMPKRGGLGADEIGTLIKALVK